MKTLSTKGALPRVRSTKRRKVASRKTSDILDLVKAGVERFILKDAPIGDFQRAVRLAAKNGELSSHPITGVVFRDIVRRAIQERKRKNRKATRAQS